MNDLPRRPVEPLPPPAGSFDSVLERSRQRRYRRASALLTVVGVFLAGLAGGMALGGPGRVRHIVVAAVTGDPLEGPTTAGPQPLPSPSAPTGAAAPSALVLASPQGSLTSATAQKMPSDAGQDRRDRGSQGDAGNRRGGGGATVAVASAPPEALGVVRGVAVSATGEPIAGLYVYPGRPGTDRYTPVPVAAARTAADGSFTLPCTGTAVLLTPWPVNAPAADPAEVSWAATFVGSSTDPATARVARCGRPLPATEPAAVTETVVLRPGALVDGAVTVPPECTETTFALWVWLHRDRAVSVRLPGVRGEGGFRVAGLPPGEHTLAGNGNRTPLTVGSGGSVTQDLTMRCVEEPDPSASAGPTPSPDPSGTPLPSATSTPQPTGFLPPSPLTSTPLPSPSAPTTQASTTPASTTPSSAPVSR